MRTGIVIFVAICLLSSCKEDQLKRNYPVVSTGDVTAVSSAGVTFTGSFSNAAPGAINDHGFVWGTSKDLSLAASLSVSLGPPTSNSFIFEVRSTLKANAGYYVRAFVKTGTNVIYGPIKKFTSLGTTSYSLDDFNPKIGKAGDTLIISGSGFNPNSINESVVFEYDGRSITAIPISSTATRIKVIIPATAVKRRVTLGVKIGDDIKRFNAEFQFMTPGILSVATPLRFCDTLRINWESYGKTLTTVTINGVAQVPVKVTATQIKLIFRIFSATLDIRIDAGSFYDQKQFEITIDNPFNSTVFPTTLSAADILTLHPSYITDCIDLIAKVKTAGNPVPFFGRTGATLQFGIQNYQDLTSSFQIEFYSSDVDKQPFFTSPMINKGGTSAWTKKKDFPGNFLPKLYPSSFVINGRGYFVGGLGAFIPGNISQETWEYSPANDQWLNIANLTFNQDGVKLPALAAGNAGYYLLDFGLFNFNGGSWSRLPAYPGLSSLYSNIAFSFGSDIFFGAGYSTVTKPAIVDNRLFRYNIASNTWSQKATPPFVASATALPSTLSFTLNNLGYYFTFQNHTLYRMVYNPASDTWTSDSSALSSPFGFGVCSAFPLTNSVLVIDESGLMCLLDPVTNTWAYKGYSPTRNGVSYTKGFGFLLDNKIYMGLGFDGVDGSRDVWQLDLSKL